MATPRTVAFHTLGCKLNFSETSSIGRLFEDAGYLEVDFKTPSDIYVINTCSVTDFADRKCRKTVRKALRNSPDAFVIVIGCYAALRCTLEPIGAHWQVASSLGWAPIRSWATSS